MVNPRRVKSRIGRPDTLVHRFWPKVDKDGPIVRPELGACWVWVGATIPGGYGQIDKRGAHIVSYELHAGRSAACLYVCHACDNPPCVRPTHLFAATALANTHDMIAKGRGVKGERVITAKLTADQVAQIISRYAAGETQVALSKAFGVGQPHISIIVRGRSWRHLEFQKGV